MRKKFFIGLIMCLTLLVSSIGLFACDCGGEKEPDVINNGSADIVSAQGFTLSGDKYVLTVTKETETFAFEGKITVSDYATWKLARDEAGNYDLSKSSVDLITGENEFFVIVTSGNAQKVNKFKFVITRAAQETFTVTFDANGGSVSTNEILVEKGFSINSPSAEKTGYLLSGWNYNGSAWNFSNPVNGDMTLVAVWTPVEYAITYILNGGTNNSANPDKYTIESNEITFAEPTKTGYTFKGWSVAGIPAGSTGTVITTASWEVVNYAITYNLNGGTNDISNPATYTVNDSINFAEPTKNGYTFKGWSVSGITAGTTGAITTTATWEITEYAINYVLNGGTNNSANPDKYTIESNEITFAEPSKTGYTFKGWSVAGIPTGSTGEITTTATWEAINYAITYVLDGGTNATTNPETYTIESDITFAEPSKTGYTFKGWSVSGITAGTTGAITTTASWEVIEYSITYVLNGGTNNPANPDKYTVESGDITFAEPSKTGCTFKGWSVSGIAAGTTGAITTTATWEATEYAINYVLNGGTNAASNPATYDIDDEITFAAPTKKGYTFKGWSVSGIAAGTTGEITTTASWEVIEYSITYVLNGGTNNSANPDKYTVESGAITFAAPTKTGYTFIKWSANGIPAGYVGDVTTTANWRITEYAINYELNGGTNNSANPAKYTIESDDITFAAPTKNGYTFTGWSVTGIPSGSTGTITTSATWEVIEYPISYVLNGGTNNSANPDKYTVESGDITFAEPSKTGYTFKGWSVASISAGSTGEITTTATWEVINYTITYELDGGINDISNPTTYTIDSEAITFAAPTKTGYNFIGWSVSGIPAESTGAVTTTASWQPIVYNINYILNGGTNAASNPTTYTIESETITLADPIKGEDEFLGWSNNGVIEAGSVGDKTFIANWKNVETYNITYVLNGGTNSTANPDTYTNQSGDIYFADPTRDGYTFKGWSIDSIAAGSTGDVTTTASWEVITYNITYALNGGTNDTQNPTSYNIESGKIIFLAPTKAGYTFKGWSVSEIPAGNTGDVTTTASWEINTYTITYVLNGGNNNISNPSTYTVESEKITFANPIRNGYTFKGWDVSEIPAGSTGDVTITATWEVIDYAIEYVLNGGTNATGNPTTYNIESGDITFAAPTREGYTFKGWSVSGITSGDTGDITTSAKWEIINYTIEYVLGGGINNYSNPSTYNVETDTITFADPIRNGYIFKNWSVSQIQKGHTGNVTTTAVWEAESYAINYVLNGGTNAATNPATYTIESGDITFAAPTKNGYTFKGWSVNGITAGTTGEVTTSASWEVISYTITYVLNGGNNNVSNPETYTIEDSINFAAPTKNGYTFKGWSVSGITAGTTGAITTTATWEAINYAITYVLNGGTNAASNPATYTIEDSITFATPTKNGYTFKGWSVAGIPAGTTGAITTTATWEAINYAITYVLNGGTNASSNPTTYTIESSNITFAAPTKNGYTFKGWSVAGIPAGTTGAITTTASWEVIEYSITYVLNGGTNASSNPTTYTIESSNITFAAPTKNGYTFKGWSVSGITAGTTGAITTTATWEAVSYTITYVLNGGTNATGNPTSYTIESETITFAAPTKTGYIGSWDPATIPQGSTGNKTITAVWTDATPYNITYNLNGGTNNPDNPTTYKVSDATITFAEPTRSGYTFKGWTPATIPQGSTGDKVITASWEIIRYTITYNLNGGTNNPNNPASYTVEDSLITFAAPTKDGYRFDGWSKTSIAAGSTGNVTTTANFTAIFTVSGSKITGLTNYGKTLDNVTIPEKIDGNNITEIADYAFEGNSLTQITFSKTITKIGTSAFLNCDSLTDVNYLGTVSDWCAVSFADKYSNPIFYAEDLIVGGSLLSGTVNVPTTVTSVGNYAFYGYTGISGVNFGTSGKLNSIGDYSFYGCINLESATFPTSFNNDNIGLYAFYGTLINIDYIYVDTSDVNVQYVVLMMSNSTCDEIETYLESMKNTFGTVNASSASRIYAFGVTGPFALNNTVETMKNTVDRSFELAEKYNIPVYFRMDDSSQYFTSSASGIAKFKNEVNCEHVSALDGNYYEHFYDDPDMCEWIALPTSTETWGGEQYGKLPKAVSNYGGSYAHVVGGFPCFNSESYLAWYDKQVNDGFIYPLTENLRRLKKLDKEYLFAGVAAGYETSIPNYSTDAIVTPGGNYSALESFEKAQFGMHAIYNITDEYGNKLYPDDAALTAGAERHGLSLAAFKRYLLVQVVHDYIEHTCKLFYDAGISKNKIFSHINAVASTNGGDEFSASAGYYNDAKIDTVALPTWVAVNDYSIPGYTMVSGSYNLTTIGNSVAKYGNGINAYANVKSNASDAGSNQTGIKSYFTSTLCANTKLITVENFESYSNSNFTAITKQWMNKQISSGYTFANRAALTYPEYSSGDEPVFPIGAIGGVAYGTNTYWNYLQSTNNAFYVHGGSGGVEFTFALKDMATITGYDSTAVISIGPDATANAFQIGLMINGDTGYVYGSYLVGTNVLIGYDTPTILGTHSTNGYLTFKIAFKIVDGVWNILFNDVSIDSTLFGANTGATFMTSDYTTNIAINSNAAINIALLSSIGFSTSSGEGGTIDPVTGAIILSPGNTYNAASANGSLLTVGAYGFKFRMGVKLTEELTSDHFKNITVSVGPETDLSDTSAAGHFQIAFMVNGEHNKVFVTFVDNTGTQKSQWVEVASLTTSDYAYFTVSIVGTTAGTWEIRIGDAMIDEGYFSSNPGGAFKNASNQLNVIIADAADTKAQVSIDEFGVYSTAVAPSSGSSGTGVTLGTLNPGEQYGNIITTGNYGFQMRVGAKLAQSLNQGENTIAIFNFGPDNLADMSTAGHFRLILMFNQENGNIMFVSYISNTGSDAAPDAPFTPIANAVLNTSDFVYFTLGIVYNTSTASWEVQINGTAVDGGKFNTLTGGGFKSSTNDMGIVVNNPANTKAIITLDNYVGVN